MNGATAAAGIERLLGRSELVYVRGNTIKKARP